MADNLETPQFGNFGIENTIDMGAGNQELLNDLLAPETSTGSPDNLEKIVKEVEDAPPTPQKKQSPSTEKAAPQVSKAEVEQEAQKNIQSFLYGEGDDDTEEESVEEEKSKAPAKKEQKAAAPVAEEAPETNEEQEEEVSQFNALSRDLFKLGVFTQDEDEEDVNISTPEEFLERFQVEKKKGAIDIVNNFIGQFGEDYQQAFEAIFVKGVDPKEYFGTYNNIKSFSEMDLSKEENQVHIIRQALADQGFDSEDIDTEVERLKNYGDLETVATKHHKVLVKKEAQKLQEVERQSEMELKQRQAFKNQYIQNVQTILQEKMKSKEFDGIPLNPSLANELQDFLLVDKYKTPSGETLTDFDRTILELKRPENHALKVKVGLLLKILEKDPTLSTIQKTGVTKKSNQLFSEVARQVERTGVKGGKKDSQSSRWFI